MNDTKLYVLLYTADDAADGNGIGDADCLTTWTTPATPGSAGIFVESIVGNANHCADWLWDFLFIPGYGSFVAPYPLPLSTPSPTAVPVQAPVQAPAQAPTSPPLLPPTLPPDVAAPILPPAGIAPPVEPPAEVFPPFTPPAQPPISRPPESLAPSSQPIQPPTAGPAATPESTVTPVTAPVLNQAPVREPAIEAPVAPRRMRIVILSLSATTPDVTPFCDAALRIRFSLSSLDVACELETFNKRALTAATNISVIASFVTHAALDAIALIGADTNLQASILIQVAQILSNSFVGIEIQMDPQVLSRASPIAQFPPFGAPSVVPLAGSDKVNNEPSATGGIVGGIIGALAAVAIVAVSALLVLRNRNLKKRKPETTDRYAEVSLMNSSGSATYLPMTATPGTESADPETNTKASSWAIAYEDLQFGKILGAGAFGQVWRGVWRGADVAIKSAIGITKEQFLKEADLMKYAFSFLSECSHIPRSSLFS
jgi:hypothetical protein